MVLAHGSALLAEEGRTIVVTADMTRPRQVLDHPDVRRLIDFSQPVAALSLSVLHFVLDDAAAAGMLSVTAGALAPGSFLALSQTVAETREVAEEHNKVVASQMGMAWKTRTAGDIREFVSGLEPVPPGLVDVADWRPDPSQPPLDPVDEPLRPFLGAAAKNKRLREFGGVLRIS